MVLHQASSCPTSGRGNVGESVRQVGDYEDQRLNAALPAVMQVGRTAVVAFAENQQQQEAARLFGSRCVGHEKVDLASRRGGLLDGVTDVARDGYPIAQSAKVAVKSGSVTIMF